MIESLVRGTDHDTIASLSLTQVKDSFLAEKVGNKGAQKNDNKGGMGDHQSPSTPFKQLVLDNDSHEIGYQ